MDKPLPLVEHLAELRRRILISVIFIFFASIFLSFFSSNLLNILKIPASTYIDKLAYFSPEEAFSIYFYISIISGFVISFPVIIYQIWKFILPALDKKYKKFTIFFVFICSFNFILGVLFAYFLFLPNALRFLLNIGKNNLVAIISATKYIRFVTYIMLAFGFIFELPILIFLLAKFGVIDVKILQKKFKYALVMILIVSAILTPTTDIFNMLILSLPLFAIYQISIWIAYFAKK
ncbi:MAG: twin-arginine translocase subunit TatC [Candidatus Omnitrophica bacterium]|nr:twin-arginine translocase subunit TatC [Candidatus Omnitrophota bacterium]MCM8832080.1 twin-arginine translocase subunit TatC [Candidatus Omnitrophota bacterium]